MNCTPVLVGGEAVDDGGEDAAAVSAAADEEHGVLGVGEGAALVLPLSARCSPLHHFINQVFGIILTLLTY